MRQSEYPKCEQKQKDCSQAITADVSAYQAQNSRANVRFISLSINKKTPTAATVGKMMNE